jgi:membrane peptidoglycan carboxypeptidase
MAVAILALLAAYAATPVPPVQPITEAQTTTVYYSDGKTVLTKFAQQNRTIVPIKRSSNIAWATVAAEDRSFYANKGVSPLGILRAAWNNARGGDLQGGSTITQQYVKNTRIDGSRTWQRKIKEFFIAIKISNESSKDEILANYLNTIYFGRNTYGVEAASQSYFHMPAAKLNLPQSAYLAGIINGPELYDVKDSDNKEAIELAKARFEHVLAGLVELGRITQDQADAFNFQRDVVNKIYPVSKSVRKEDDQTIYLEQMVRSELNRQGHDFSEVSRGGYKVYTTFDKKLIDEAVKSVHDSAIGIGPRKKWPKGTEVGLVSLDPRSGAVRAIYGGNGTRSYSAATQDSPQAGSIYKTFTLLAALEGDSTSKDGSNGISLRSRFSGRSPYRYDSKYVGTGSNKVTNFDGEQFGKIDLLTATEHSVNTVYAQLNEKLDAGKRTQNAAIRAGLTKDEIGSEVSNTLGNGNPHVVDMASAYGTIAAGGVHHPYYVVEKIVSPQKEVIYTRDTSGKRQFSKGVTADATYALQQVVKGGTGTYARRLDRPVAGKTGTVGGNGRETMAAWFVGFTPQLSTAVVIHRVGSKGEPDVVKGWGPFGGRDMQGGMFPVRVWTSFMGRALDGQPVIDFPEPEWVGEDVDPAPVEPVAVPSPSALPLPTDRQNDQDPNNRRNDQDPNNRRNDQDPNNRQSTSPPEQSSSPAWPPRQPQDNQNDLNGGPSRQTSSPSGAIS